MTHIGKKIKKRREELGLTQEELAHKLGYKSKSTVNKIEMGINDITQTRVVAFAKALNTTPAYLMDWEIADVFHDDMQQDSIQKLHSLFSSQEVTHFENYLQLNEHNMKLVDNYTEKLLSIQEMEEEVYINAAHQRTDIKVPEETDTSDNDIMDDENF